MFDHVADALAREDLVRLRDDLYVLRFETMKVASALGAVQQLMEEGCIRPGDTLVDSSSGIYAYSLALACHKYGFKCHIVASPSVDLTLKTQLEFLGVTVDQPCATRDASLDQAERVRRVMEYVNDHQRAHWMGQYHDPVHYAGYRPIAQRIADSLRTDSLTLVTGVGSGASSGGLTTALMEAGVDVDLIGVQPFGSVSFGSQDINDPKFLISGLGSGIYFGNIRYAAFRSVHWMGFDYARSGSIDLLRHHGVFAGLSSGAAYLTASWSLDHRPTRRGEPVVFVAADTGHRYVPEVFASTDPVVTRAPSLPLFITRQDELQLPWCRTDWSRHGTAFPTPAPSV